MTIGAYVSAPLKPDLRAMITRCPLQPSCVSFEIRHELRIDDFKCQCQYPLGRHRACLSYLTRLRWEVVDCWRSPTDKKVVSSLLEPWLSIRGWLFAHCPVP